MRRIVYILIMIVVAMLTAQAQEGLNISRIFDGRYKDNKNATEVLVKGRKLAPYNLSLFRSLTVKDAPEDFKLIESLVVQDGQIAIDKETGKIGGILYYGFYQLPPLGEKYRYLFFKNTSLRNQAKKEVTVVYMEGNTTLEQLKNIFK